MSLEAALAENTAALTEQTVALLRVAENQQRLIAGQQAAIEKIDAGKGATAERKPRGAKADPAPAPAAEVKPEPAPKTEENGVTDDDIRAAAAGWMDGKSKEDRAEAAKFLTAILEEFGTGGKLTGPESKLDADQRKQALFFIQRKAAGLAVDFKADYDFDGDPTEGADEEDPLG